MSPCIGATACPYDYHRLLHTFRMKSRIKDVGIFRPPHRWEFSAGVKLVAAPVARRVTACPS